MPELAVPHPRPRRPPPWSAPAGPRPPRPCPWSARPLPPRPPAAPRRPFAGAFAPATGRAHVGPSPALPPGPP